MSKYKTTIEVVAGNLDRFLENLKWKTLCFDGLLMMVSELP